MKVEKVEVKICKRSPQPSREVILRIIEGARTNGRDSIERVVKIRFYKPFFHNHRCYNCNAPLVTISAIIVEKPGWRDVNHYTEKKSDDFLEWCPTCDRIYKWTLISKKTKNNFVVLRYWPKDL